MKTKQINVLLICMIYAFVSATTYGQNSYSSESENQAVDKYNDFRFSVGGGYALRLGKIIETGDSKLDDMSRKLRHGYTVDADAQYFFKEGWGLGVNANRCSSNTSGNDINIPDLDKTVNSYKESQNILFVGPSFATRKESDKFLIISSIAVGPLFYTDKMTLDGVVVNGKKTVVGVNAGFGGEYKLNASTGIGLKLSYTLGNVSSINIEGQSVDYDDTINLSNLMATLFISFRTW